MDKNNSLWLGSTTGLRILPNALSDLYGTKVKVNPIVITQNGIAEELFKDAEILSIAVDSGNNKWVSVNGGGVFFLSALMDRRFTIILPKLILLFLRTKLQILK